MDSTKEDIRKILLLHENPEKVLADYMEAKLKEERERATTFAFSFMILLGILIFMIC